MFDNFVLRSSVGGSSEALIRSLRIICHRDIGNSCTGEIRNLCFILPHIRINIRWNRVESTENLHEKQHMAFLMFLASNKLREIVFNYPHEIELSAMCNNGSSHASTWAGKGKMERKPQHRTTLSSRRYIINKVDCGVAAFSHALHVSIPFDWFIHWLICESACIHTLEKDIVAQVCVFKFQLMKRRR